MALSAQTYIGDGINTDFVLDFTLGYISTNHIHVFLDEVEVDQNTLTFINAGGSVRLASPPGVGVVVLVRRIVPNDKLQHDYQNGALVIEQNLDDSNRQAIMLQHESIDGFISRGAGQNFDMSNFRIINLADPVDPQDAMTFAASLQAVTDAQTAETNASASAAAALVSETNAAASEANAQAFATLFDNSLDPQGDWDASGGNFPATPTPVGGITPAKLYRISVGGTLTNATQTIVVNVDDHIYWNPVDSEWAYFVINGVQISSPTGQAQIPAGTTAERDTEIGPGEFRFNTDLGVHESWDGTSWKPTGGVEITDSTGFAKIPTGTTAQRGTGVEGGFRRNNETGFFEGYDGTIWTPMQQLTAGSVVQEQYVMYTGTQSIAVTAGTPFDVSGLTATITPKFADSIIKIEVICNNEFSSIINFDMIGFISRNAVDVRGAPTAGSRRTGIGVQKQGFWDSNAVSTIDTLSFTYFDTPASTALQTYVLRIESGESGTMYINRSVSDTDSAAYQRTVSTIVLTEIKA